jgi:uncharacterized coiled-coil protein SlyX
MLFNPRNGAQPNGAQQTPSEQIEMQAVRELLFGETQRALEARIQRLESTLASLESGLDQRFRDLSQRFEELARASATQQSALREVGRSFAELGQQLAGTPSRDAGGIGPHVRKPE